MTRFEAEALAMRIGRYHWRTHAATHMWVGPGQYKVVVTHKASNTQFDVTDPQWEPTGDKKAAAARTR